MYPSSHHQYWLQRQGHGSATGHPSESLGLPRASRDTHLGRASSEIRCGPHLIDHFHQLPKSGLPLQFGRRSWDSPLRDPRWQHVDDLLYDLVNRLRLLGYQHTLEVEVRVVEFMSLKQGLDDEGFLPRFRKKGRVKMLEGRSGRCFLLS